MAGPDHPQHPRLCYAWGKHAVPLFIFDLAGTGRSDQCDFHEVLKYSERQRRSVFFQNSKLIDPFPRSVILSRNLLDFAEKLALSTTRVGVKRNHPSFVVLFLNNLVSKPIEASE